MYDRLEGRVKNSLTRVLIDHIKSSRSVPSHTEVTQVHPKISPVRVVSRAQRNCFQLHSVFCLYPALPEYQIHDFLFFCSSDTTLIFKGLFSNLTKKSFWHRHRNWPQICSSTKRNVLNCSLCVCVSEKKTTKQKKWPRFIWCCLSYKKILSGSFTVTADLSSAI